MELNFIKSSHRETNAYNTRFDKYALVGGKVRIGFKAYPAPECAASISETGTSENKYFGGAGASREGARKYGPIGYLAQVNKTHTNNNQGWFILQTPGGVERTKLKGDKFIKARQFVMNLNLEKDRQLHI